MGYQWPPCLEVGDAAHLALGDAEHADGGDEQQVERRGPHDGRRAQLAAGQGPHPHSATSR